MKHVGILGNERVDKKAKQALRKDKIYSKSEGEA